MAIPKVRDGRLEWLQVLRSNDLFLGVPYNLVQFTMLQEVMAGWLGLEPGTYTHLANSLHLYTSDISRLEILHSQTKANPDRYKFSYEETTEVVAELVRWVDEIVRAEGSPSGLNAAWLNNGLPAPYRNLLSVLLAESSRRHGQLDQSMEFISTCKNPALRQVWNSWRLRWVEESDS